MRQALPNPEPSQPPKRATGIRQALPNPTAEKSQPPKRATGMRQALPEPPPEGAGETLMLNPDALLKAGQAAQQNQKADDPGPEAANATVMFSAIPDKPAAKARGLADDDSPTAAKNLARDDKPTASKRPLQDLVDGGGGDDDASNEGLDEGNPATFRGENTSLGHKARTMNGMTLVTTGLLLLVAAATTAHFVAGRVATPGRDELELMYPFGSAGKVMPNGRTAPPARMLIYDMIKADDCDGFRCLTYHIRSEDNGFNYEMVVRDNDGVWGVVSSHLAEPLPKPK